jgi:putative NADH-flavin reductase
LSGDSRRYLLVGGAGSSEAGSDSVFRDPYH